VSAIREVMMDYIYITEDDETVWLFTLVTVRMVDQLNKALRPAAPPRRRRLGKALSRPHTTITMPTTRRHCTVNAQRIAAVSSLMVFQNCV
jgi:hypothetical protein